MQTYAAKTVPSGFSSGFPVGCVRGMWAEPHRSLPPMGKGIKRAAYSCAAREKRGGESG